MISKGCLVRTPRDQPRGKSSVCLVISDPYVHGPTGRLFVDLLVSGTNEVRQYYVDRLQVISQ
jgi:hypothetical protein